MLHSKYEWFRIHLISAYLNNGNNSCNFVKTTFKCFMYLRRAISTLQWLLFSPWFILWSFPPVMYRIFNPWSSSLCFTHSGISCPGKPSRCNFFKLEGKMILISLYLVSNTPMIFWDAQVSTTFTSFETPHFGC